MSVEPAPVSTDKGWSLLRSGGQQTTALGIPTMPTDVASQAGRVRIALGENGELRLLLPLLTREALEHTIDTPSIRAVISIYQIGTKTVRFLDLTCLDKNLEDVFSEVTDEILARIAAGADSGEAANSTIEDFRALLLKSSVSSVSVSAVAGVVGELLVLNRLLDRTPRAWRAWNGPRGDRHDFRCGHLSLEVKATTRASNDVIVVHSLEQMAAPAGGSLNLLHFVLEQVLDGRLSVSALGRAAIEKADKPNAVRDLLALVGCDDVDAAEWNAWTFRHEKERQYVVRPGFPCLTPAMLADGRLPSGIHGLTYSIDLAAAAPFACTPGQSAEFDKAFVSCI